MSMELCVWPEKRSRGVGYGIEEEEEKNKKKRFEISKMPLLIYARASHVCNNRNRINVRYPFHAISRQTVNTSSN